MTSRVVLFGQDVGARGGVFMATAGLAGRPSARTGCSTPPFQRGQHRGRGGGHGRARPAPVAEIQFADYMGPGFDQIISQAAKMRYRSGGQFTAPLVIRTPVRRRRQGRAPPQPESRELLHATRRA